MEYHMTPLWERIADMALNAVSLTVVGTVISVLVLINVLIWRYIL